MLAMRAHVLRLLTPAFALGAIAIIARTFPPHAAGFDGSAGETKVNQVLAEMSPQEKIGQLSQLFYFANDVDLPGSAKGAPPTEDLVAKGSVGSLLFIT